MKLAFVAYYFPPYAGVGGVRAEKLSKYFLRNRLDVTVLAAHPSHYSNVSGCRDNSDLEGLKRSYLRLPGGRFSGPMLKFLFPFLVFFRLIMIRKKIDVILITGCPFYPFFITFLIKIALRKPVVLDFRDSWSFNHGYDGRPRAGVLGRLREVLTGAIEKGAIKNCSAAVFSTKMLMKEYSILYPFFRSKFFVAENGFDHEDFECVAPESISEGDTIVIAGKFLKYTPEAFVPLVECVAEKDNLKLVYVGDEKDSIAKLVARYSFEDQVIVKPFMPYKKALGIISGSKYGLLSTGLRNGLGTKIFDYIALGKPTLCLVPPGSEIESEFLNSELIVICKSPHSKESIMCGLSELECRARSIENSHAAGSEYTRENSASKMISVLMWARSSSLAFHDF